MLNRFGDSNKGSFHSDRVGGEGIAREDFLKDRTPGPESEGIYE